MAGPWMGIPILRPAAVDLHPCPAPQASFIYFEIAPASVTIFVYFGSLGKKEIHSTSPLKEIAPFE